MSDAYTAMRADPAGFLRAIIDGDTAYADFPAYTADAIRLVIDAPPPQGWVCFHCGEALATKAGARAHFGGGEECTPACQIKASEGGLVRAVREAEEALFQATSALHDENGEAVKAMRAMASRFGGAMIAAEQTGYERGLADMRASVERLRRIVASYASKGRMATHIRSDWQIEIGEATRFVADNPEPD